MEIPQEVKNSVPFEYARQVKAGEIVTGRLVRLAVDRFYTWIDQADNKGYILDHAAGLHIINFFELFIKQIDDRL